MRKTLENSCRQPCTCTQVVVYDYTDKSKASHELPEFVIVHPAAAAICTQDLLEKSVAHFGLSTSGTGKCADVLTSHSPFFLCDNDVMCTIRRWYFIGTDC